MTPEHFLLIADALPDPLVLLSGDGRVLAGNSAVRELLGLQPNVLRGRALAEIAADPPDEVAHYLRLCSRSRNPVLGAMVLRGPGGDIACRTFGSLVSPNTEGADAFVLLRLVPKQAAAGQFIALNRQIEELRTEVQRRKRAEEEARRQEERLRVTLLSIGDAVIASDTAGRVTSLNPVAESLTGWTTADAAGQPLETVFRIVNESTRRPVENPALRALKEGVIVGLANHTVLIARDGTERPVEDSAAPIRSASGEVIGCVLVFRDVGERRRLEGERREAQERVVATLESVTDGFVRYDRDWRIVYVNAEAERINKLTRSEMLGKTPWELFPALVGTKLETEFRRAVAEQVTVEFENHYEPFGRWYALKGYPTADGGLTTFIRDITDRKRAEDVLRRSEARFRRVFESNVVGMIRWDLDRSLILDANDEFLRMTGYTRDDVAAGRLNFRDMTPPEWTPRNEEGIRTIRADGHAAPYEKEYFRKDGSRVPLIIAGTRFDDSPSEGMSLLMDISDRKRAEREVVRLAADAERQRRLFDTALSNTTDYTFLFDLDGRVVYANRALLALWERTADQALGKTLAELDYPADTEAQVSRNLRRVIETGEVVRDETPYTGPTAVTGHFEYILAPVLDAGRVILVAGSSRDITGRKRMEDTLRDQAERLREADRRKDEFLATLAHELRNPLAPIRNGLQVIRMAGANGTIEQARSMMERQLTQLVRLVDDLLDVSRVTSGKLELRTGRVELRAVIDAAVETSRPLIEQAGHDLAVVVPDEPILVDGDLTRLAQVVSNLLTNSAKYMHRGGHIRLSVERDGDSAVVAVKDTGIGIPPAMLDKVFEMFIQVDRTLEKTTGGLGIGLSLVKRLVEMHGGNIEARSEGAGKGSEFVVRLPVAASVGGRDGTRGRAEEVVASGPRRILVVDDNADAADSLGQLLELLGNEVRTAYDGGAGVAAAGAFRPAVVLCDIGMPKVNGYEVCRRIRAEPWGKNVVLVALTGWGQEDDRAKSADAGFDFHLVKPVEAAALMKLLAGVETER